jgi:hypothetical protein
VGIQERRSRQRGCAPLLIIVKGAAKKFHLRKMPPRISPAKGQWRLGEKGKSKEHKVDFRLQIGDRQNLPNRLNWH